MEVRQGKLIKNGNSSTNAQPNSVKLTFKA